MTKVNSNSTAAKNGRIREGDRILRVHHIFWLKEAAVNGFYFVSTSLALTTLHLISNICGCKTKKVQGKKKSCMYCSENEKQLMFCDS